MNQTITTHSTNHRGCWIRERPGADKPFLAKDLFDRPLGEFATLEEAQSAIDQKLGVTEHRKESNGHQDRKADRTGTTRRGSRRGVAAPPGAHHGEAEPTRGSDLAAGRPRVGSPESPAPEGPSAAPAGGATADVAESGAEARAEALSAAEVDQVPGIDASRDAPGASGPVGDAVTTDQSAVPRVGDATAVSVVLSTDPHTLDEYLEALVFAAPRLPCKVEAVRRFVWGFTGSGTGPGREATELALEELVAQGRADRNIDGKYRPRLAASDVERRTESASELLEQAKEEWEERDPDLPDVPSDPPPAPGDILDPDVLRPEEPAECGELCDVCTGCDDQTKCPALPDDDSDEPSAGDEVQAPPPASVCPECGGDLCLMESGWKCNGCRHEEPREDSNAAPVAPIVGAVADAAYDDLDRIISKIEAKVRAKCPSFTTLADVAARHPPVDDPVAVILRAQRTLRDLPKLRNELAVAIEALGARRKEGRRALRRITRILDRGLA